MNTFFNLTGKVAIVTGASSGLGASAALAYAECGADCALLARRKEKLEDVAKEIKDLGRKVLIVPCDVSEEESVKNAVEEVVKEFGKVDILLNNAGVAVRGAVENLAVEDWNRAMDINVKGIYLMSKYVVPQMRAQKYGRIVNIASVNAVIADKTSELTRHSYNASKAAVRGLTTGMAATYMQDNITVNSLGPGLFESEMTEKTLFKHEGFMSSYNMQNPAGRPGMKGELNGPILFFSSDACSYVTGQHLIVDGGFSIV